MGVKKTVHWPSTRRSESTRVYTTTSRGQVVTLTSVVTAVVSEAIATVTNGGSGSSGRSLNDNSASSGSGSGSGSFFDNTGAVAGTFVVVGLVAAALAALLAWLLVRRRRRRNREEDVRVAAGGAGDGGAGVDRFNDDDDEVDGDDIFADHRHSLVGSGLGGAAGAAAAGANPFGGDNNNRSSMYSTTAPSMSQYHPHAPTMMGYARGGSFDYPYAGNYTNSPPQPSAQQLYPPHNSNNNGATLGPYDGLAATTAAASSGSSGEHFGGGSGGAGSGSGSGRRDSGDSIYPSEAHANNNNPFRGGSDEGNGPPRVLRVANPGD